MSSPLINAISFGDINMVKELIDAGADVNESDQGLFLPIVVASSRRTPIGLAILKLLIDRGADVNKVEDGLGLGTTTALIAAVTERNIEGVKLLLDAGADPSGANDSGLTPLHYAANFSGDYDIVKILLASGADVHAKTKYGHIPHSHGIGKSGKDIKQILKVWPAIRNSIQSARATHRLPRELQGEVASYLTGTTGRRGVQHGPRIPGVDQNYVGDQLRELAPHLENAIRRARSRVDPEFAIREPIRRLTALRSATKRGGSRKKLHRKRHSFSRRKL